MLTTPKLPFDTSIEILKALGEQTRLRLVRLLACSDLTVSELTAILGQSQPRISRHLRLLVESGVLSRYQEGAWAYFRLSEAVALSSLTAAILTRLDGDDPILQRDVDRLNRIRRERAERAADYFARNAGRWDKLRSLHVADAAVEATLLLALGDGALGEVLDIGTGTGRLVELLAPRATRTLGIDASREMLQIARAKLDAASLANVQVRQGDCYRLPLPRAAFDLVTIHQVLHYLDDPAAAVREAASMLRLSGRLAIVDFAPHDLEFLRDEQAHLRLGFSPETLAGYLADAGLDVETTRLLAPDGARPDQLTVIVMIARNRQAAGERRTNAAPIPATEILRAS